VPNYRLRFFSFEFTLTVLAAAMLLLSSPNVLAQTAEPAASYESGQQLYQARQYQKAVKVLTAALQTSKPNLVPSIYYTLGCCYLQLKNTEQARHCFVLVRDRYPQSREAALAISVVGSGAASSTLSASAVKTASVTENQVIPAARTAVSRSLRQAGGQVDDISTLPPENRFYFKPASNGHMEVQAYLNDHPVTCWFDTGANAHFGKNHLREAGIPEPTGRPTCEVVGWAGNTVPAWQVYWTIQLGNMKRKVAVTVEENMTLPPLLGQEFVNGYNYEIDHASGVVTMKKETVTSSVENNLWDLPCIQKDGRDIVTIQLNGKTLPVMLDTGTSRTIFDPKDLASIGIRPAEDLPTVSLTGVGGSMSMREMMMEVRLGPFSSTIPVLVTRSGGGSAIGQDVLQNRRFTIDTKKHLLRFFH
jgi:predicted aspartyl protease